ncbi:MAG: 30S ribosomal protein S6 [Fimbriimonadaceae bacterium]|nr:30S ribosomal protein S6 [Fimbriimonadaceae bacterium]
MNTRKYEAIYIVSGQLSDGDVQKIADRYKDVVEKQGGTVESAKKWQKRKLAYEIDDHRDGNYILMLFQAPAEVPAELNRQMNNAEDVIRHRIISLPKNAVQSGETLDSIEPAEVEA